MSTTQIISLQLDRPTPVLGLPRGIPPPARDDRADLHPQLEQTKQSYMYDSGIAMERKDNGPLNNATPDATSPIFTHNGPVTPPETSKSQTMFEPSAVPTDGLHQRPLPSQQQIQQKQVHQKQAQQGPRPPPPLPPSRPEVPAADDEWNHVVIQQRGLIYPETSVATDLYQETDVLDKDMIILAREVIHFRDRTTSKRYEREREREHIVRQLEHAFEAQKRFMSLAGPIMAALQGMKLPDGVDMGRLNDAWKGVRSTNQTLSIAEKRMIEVDNDFEKNEARLLTRELDLYEALRRYNGMSVMASNQDDENDRLDSNGSFSARSGTSVVTHPYVRRYYDRIGDANILRERIFNWESEHERQTYHRQTGPSDEPRVPTPEFLERYYSERGDLIQEFSVAREEVVQLKELCEKEGIQVEEPNFPEDTEEIGLDKLGKYHRIGRSASPSNAAPPKGPNLPPDGGLLHPQAQARDGETAVIRWLQGVQLIGKSSTDGDIESLNKSPDLPNVWNGEDEGFMTEDEAKDAVPLPNYDNINQGPRPPSINLNLSNDTAAPIAFQHKNGPILQPLESKATPMEVVAGQKPVVMDAPHSRKVSRA